MNRLIRNIIVIFASVLFLAACEKKVQLPSNKFVQRDSTSNEMIKLNKLLTDVENKDIKSYVDSSSFPFKLSNLGFLYVITEQGTGNGIEKGDKILVEYEMQTLQGAFCYSYTGKNTKEMIVGKDERQRGFNNAITMLKEGGKGVFIIPSYLAYGMLGDANKIPPRATLVYKVLSVKLK
ncbi:MAG: FKBP-type peptidyl-prolyl cis-trans isomerase [Paludibacteraceae bacterium]|nr:FKBP-type peptidyl-prolyl cis-trans isomerase [Paludibacteraceae bacterium]